MWQASAPRLIQCPQGSPPVGRTPEGDAWHRHLRHAPREGLTRLGEVLPQAANQRFDRVGGHADRARSACETPHRTCACLRCRPSKTPLQKGLPNAAADWRSAKSRAHIRATEGVAYRYPAAGEAPEDHVSAGQTSKVCPACPHMTAMNLPIFRQGWIGQGKTAEKGLCVYSSSDAGAAGLRAHDRRRVAPANPWHACRMRRRAGARGGGAEQLTKAWHLIRIHRNCTVEVT